MEKNTYWKDLASMACRRLIEQNNEIAAAVIKNGTMGVRFDSHDNWNGGIDYWTIVFILKYNDYIAVESQKPQIEKDLTAERLFSVREMSFCLTELTCRTIPVNS